MRNSMSYLLSVFCNIKTLYLYCLKAQEFITVIAISVDKILYLTGAYFFTIIMIHFITISFIRGLVLNTHDITPQMVVLQ